MSADRWSECPGCCKNYKNKLDEAYGKVSKKEYQKLILSDYDEYSLREDYEIGISKGKFYVNYRGECEQCGFEFNYNYKEKINIDE
jgi:hypothetical protein